MTLQAQFTVYGRDIDELKEAAFAQGAEFFRCHERELTLEELHAIPVVSDNEGRTTRWKAHVKMEPVEEDE